MAGGEEEREKGHPRNERVHPTEPDSQQKRELALMRLIVLDYHHKYHSLTIHHIINQIMNWMAQITDLHKMVSNVYYF